MDIVLLIMIGVCSRLAPHPANMTAVGGLALFSGSRFEIKKAIAVPILTMFLSDAVLGFHSVMWATYGSVLGAVLLGKLLHRQKNTGRIIGITFLSSFVFYLVTNYAVWAVQGSMYPHTFFGLIRAYIMALPFFRNSLIGDFSYSMLFFYGYEWAINSMRVRLSS